VTELTRTQEQFEFIELVLAYEGILTNQRLRDRFGVSNVQSSRILSAYQQAHPDNIRAEGGKFRGRYVPDIHFTPAVARLNLDRYFHFAFDADGPVGMEDSGLDFTRANSSEFRILHSAISKQTAVRAIYRSMSHPEGRERVLHPLAFAFAGRRWHMRAFDELSAEHRDFNLSRLSHLTPADKRVKTPPDPDWDTFVSLTLVPHPHLSEPQQKLIRDELFDGTAARIVKTRRALVEYVLRELEVARDPQFQRPPEYQIFLRRIE